MSIDRIVRIVSLTALFVALLDAARMLGVGWPIVDRLTEGGAISFAYLGAFTLARLFSSVGMWIETNWGTILLFLAGIVELVVVLSGTASFQINIFGWVLRAALIIGTGFILGRTFWERRQGLHE